MELTLYFNTDENNKKVLIDYRHHGDISGVTFRWPDPLKSRTVTFKGILFEVKQRKLYKLTIKKYLWN